MSPVLIAAIFACALAGAYGPDRALREQVGRADETFKAGRWAEARAQYEALLGRRGGPSKTLREQIARCLQPRGRIRPGSTSSGPCSKRIRPTTRCGCGWRGKS